MNKSQALELRKNPKIQAFLDMIGYSEGAGYRTLVHKGRNNTAIKDLSRHPKTIVKTDQDGRAVSSKLWSNASGRYQLMGSTWERFRSKLGLKDFSPESQDIACIAQLAEVGAITPILNGDIETAISKARKVWASFPGAGYGQGEHSVSKLVTYYNGAYKVFAKGVKFVSEHPGEVVAGGSSIVGLLLIAGTIFF